MRWNSLLCISLALVLFPAASSGEDASQHDFTYYVERANAAGTRDEKVEYFEKALAARPGDADNIAIEFQIASLLQTDTSPNQPIKPLVALEYYEKILTTYKYDDYYAMHFEEGGGWMDLRQSLFVQSAIQAGCIRNYVLKEPEKAREYLYKALEMLNSTFQRRKADWAKEPKPTFPPISSRAKYIEGPGERAQRGREYAIEQWMQRQKRAEDGDVFERMELSNAEIAVKHYGLTFGPQPPELVPVPMRQIIAAFPGTPMARIAQEHIDRAMKMATRKIGKESDKAVMDAGVHHEPVPQVSDLDRRIESLGIHWGDEAGNEQAAHDLAAMGPEVAGKLKAGLYEEGRSFAWHHFAIRALELMKTPEAREILLEIGLGKVPASSEVPHEDEWAARAYLATLDDKSRARDLLPSNEPRIQNITLLALRGQGVDAGMWDALSAAMKSPDRSVRWASAEVLGSDPAEYRVSEKVGMIVAAAADIVSMPDASKPARNSAWTLADNDYNRCINALSHMPGALDTLRRATSDASLVQRYILAIARGRAGDATARTELVRVLRDPDAGSLRQSAAYALGTVGTVDDLALLRDLQRNDPLERPTGSDVRMPNEKPTFFPVRDAATQAIRDIEARTH